MSNFEGLDDVLKAFDSVASTDEIKSAMGIACALVERSAIQKAPKGYGGSSGLRGSIKSKVEVGGTEVRGIVYTPLEYAPYVEYGTGLFAENGNGRKDVPWNYKDDKGNWHSTSGQRPQPFLRPALEENREEILRILKEGIGND